MSLILTLFGVAVLFVAMEAHFLAAVQVIVYAGAIVVLVPVRDHAARRRPCREPVDRADPDPATPRARRRGRSRHDDRRRHRPLARGRCDPTRRRLDVATVTGDTDSNIRQLARRPVPGIRCSHSN
jgi:hypothetical protein